MNHIDTPKNRLIEILFAISKYDLNSVFNIRNDVFGKEQNYSKEDLDLSIGFNKYFLLYKENGEAIGTQTFQIGRKPGDVEIDKYFDLTPFYKTYKQLVFCSRNAVIFQKRNSHIALLLYYCVYKFCCNKNIPCLITDCRVHNEISMKLFPKLGFEMIGECKKGTIGKVIVWKALIDDIKNMQSRNDWRIINRFTRNVSLPVYFFNNTHKGGVKCLKTI